MGTFLSSKYWVLICKIAAIKSTQYLKLFYQAILGSFIYCVLLNCSNFAKKYPIF